MADKISSILNRFFTVVMGTTFVLFVVYVSIVAMPDFFNLSEEEMNVLTTTMGGVLVVTIVFFMAFYGCDPSRFRTNWPNVSRCAWDYVLSIFVAILFGLWAGFFCPFFFQPLAWGLNPYLFVTLVALLGLTLGFLVGVEFRKFVDAKYPEQ